MRASVFTSRLEDASSSTKSFRLRSSPRASASSCRSPRLGHRLLSVNDSYRQRHTKRLREVAAITGYHCIQLLRKRLNNGFAVRLFECVPYLLVGAGPLEIEVLSDTQLEQ